MPPTLIIGAHSAAANKTRIPELPEVGATLRLALGQHRHGRAHLHQIEQFPHMLIQ